MLQWKPLTYLHCLKRWSNSAKTLQVSLVIYWVTSQKFLASISRGNYIVSTLPLKRSKSAKIWGKYPQIRNLAFDSYFAIFWNANNKTVTAARIFFRVSLTCGSNLSCFITLNLIWNLVTNTKLFFLQVQIVSQRWYMHARGWNISIETNAVITNTWL